MIGMGIAETLDRQTESLDASRSHVSAPTQPDR